MLAGFAAARREGIVNRRDFVKFGGVAAIELGAARLLMSQIQPGMQSNAPASDATKPAFTLRLAPVLVELTPTRTVSTIGYNGTSPGPLLRMREGKPVTVEVINDTDVPELVHWHGLFIPPEVDGVEEESTPIVPPHGRIRYQFVPRPAGTRWYHTHTMAGADLHRGAYTGQFGFLLIESANNPGNYDKEVFLALREWEPFFNPEGDDDDDASNSGPQPERPKTLDTSPSGLEVGYQMFSINDKYIGPGERVDAIVEMTQPGIWILGTTMDDARNSGMGILVEYANQHKQPQWVTPPKSVWDYTIFGRSGIQPAPDQTIDMIFLKVPSGAGPFNSWTVNGKEYPHDQEFVLKKGGRCRLVFRNRSEDAHPLHMHRHSFELVEINGKATAGIMKDTVVGPGYGRATVDKVEDQPGLTLFHCHIQQHMDYGFKALFRYA